MLHPSCSCSVYSHGCEADRHVSLWKDHVRASVHSEVKDAALMALPYRIFGNYTVRYTSYSILLRRSVLFRRCLNTLGWCICLFGHRSVRLNRPTRGYLEAIQRLNRNANIARCARIILSVESYEVNRVNTVLWRNSVMPYVYGTTYAVFYAVAASLI